MEIRITVEIDDLIRRLDDTLRRAEGMREAMPAELTDWQERDMGRMRPNTSVPDPHTVVTMIWPRARQVGTRRHRSQSRLLRARRQSRGNAVTARRPILRPELFTMLRDRMSELLGKSFTWH